MAKSRKRPEVPIQCRAKPSKWLKQRVLEAQSHRCLGCDKVLADVEFDHVIPLGLGGLNAPENWAALCPRCHRRKTADDLRRIAKAKRQRRYHETGRSRAPSQWAPFGSTAHFPKHWRRHVNGMVTRRCACALCRESDGEDAASSAGRP